MAAGEEKSGDLYAVLGLKKECSDADLRIAYKKHAMRWHPDKFSASGNAKRVEEAKEKFQQIQGAYSVLSDSNKRFLYDVGVYDSDGDDETNNGMEEFLGEMAQMMSQTKTSEKGNETFEELQQLFVEMFHSDLGSGFARSGPGGAHGSNGHYCPSSSSSSSSSSMSPPGGSNGNKRDSSAMSAAQAKTNGFDLSPSGFCLGLNDSGQSSKGRGGGGSSSSSKRRNGRKQKVSSKHDVSSLDAEISA